MHAVSGACQQGGDVVQPLGVLEADGSALVDDGPIVAILAEHGCVDCTLGILDRGRDGSSQCDDPSFDTLHAEALGRAQSFLQVFRASFPIRRPVASQEQLGVGELRPRDRRSSADPHLHLQR